MTAMFKIPSPVSDDGKIPWESMELTSLPAVLAKQVKAIHEAQEAIKAMKKTFAEQFNASYSEEIPAGMTRIFAYNFNGMSFANVEAKARRGGKAKVQFTAKKSK